MSINRCRAAAAQAALNDAGLFIDRCSSAGRNRGCPQTEKIITPSLRQADIHRGPLLSRIGAGAKIDATDVAGDTALAWASW